MKKLKENFLESPPTYSRQLIPMIKQISVWTKLFIYSKFKLSILSFQLGFEEHIPESKILKFAQQIFNTLNCILST